jgi:AcrR family transcriptional regulator
MNMSEKEDLRIRKTRASLYKGILKLMQEKQIEQIKITDICKESMINRSTFYDHFHTIQELLVSLIQDSKEELILELKKVKNKKNNIKDYYLLLIESFVSYIEKHITIKSTIELVKRNDYQTIYNMIVDIFMTCSKEEIKNNYQNTSTTPIEMITLFYSSGIAKVLLEESNWKIEELLQNFNTLLPDNNYIKPKK